MQQCKLWHVRAPLDGYSKIKVHSQENSATSVLDQDSQCGKVTTGACGKATNFKSKNMKFYDNVNNNSAMEKCTTAKKFWVEKPSKVRSYTDINKSALRQSNKNKVD